MFLLSELFDRERENESEVKSIRWFITITWQSIINGKNYYVNIYEYTRDWTWVMIFNIMNWKHARFSRTNFGCFSWKRNIEPVNLSNKRIVLLVFRECLFFFFEWVVFRLFSSRYMFDRKSTFHWRWYQMINYEVTIPWLKKT